MRRPRVFCSSLADWLDDEVPIDWLADLLNLIHNTPNLDWLLLTKRPENFSSRFDAVMEHGAECEDWIEDWAIGRPPDNVWFGVSVEDQVRADLRIPILIQIPAWIRFLSVEPMLGPIELTGIHTGQIHWVIFGGESGGNARPCDLAWISAGVEQCHAAGVPVFVKQLGRMPAWSNREGWAEDRSYGPWMKDIHGPRLEDPKGGDMDEWPAELRLREFPA